MKANEFLGESLSRAHAALLKELSRLQRAVEPASRDDLPSLRLLLAATRELITKHFRFEEVSGYLEVVQAREPRLERTVKQLADEHVQLSQSLDAIIAQANAAEVVNEALRRQVREWLKAINRHEEHENDTVQDAFNFDVGAED